MRTLVNVSGLWEQNAGKALLEKLGRVYPEGRITHYFELRLYRADERVQKVLDILAKHGWTAWEDHSREIDRSREFHMTLQREYDSSDHSNLDYLELSPNREFPSLGPYRDEKTGYVMLDVHRLDNSLDFALADSERYVMPERAKRLLESGELRHVSFKPALLWDQKQAVDAVIPWEEWGPPWWELASDYTLPPVSPSMDLRDRHGKPIDRTDANASHVRKEGLYNHAELHYRASDLSKCEPFDLAHTYERFGGEMRWNERTLVASKRFYDFCCTHNLKTDWVPVRLDSDGLPPSGTQSGTQSVSLAKQRTEDMERGAIVANKQGSAMKTLAHVGALFRGEIPDEVFHDLAQIYPDGQYPEHVFRSGLSLEDARTRKIVRRLEQAGFGPWKDHSRPRDKACEYGFSLQREYERNDLVECEYLELAPRFPGEFLGQYRDEKTGSIKLHLHRLDNSLDFALPDSERYVVPERVKRVLESAVLQHVLFRPTLLWDPKQGVDAIIPWEDWGPPWWEITSDYMLPPVSPSMDIRDFQGKILADRSDPNALHVRKEGLYLHPELHYRASDIRKCEPFDLARTYERFGGEMKWNERTLVASKRFYDFCREHGLKTEWGPVRIDPD